MVSRPSSPSPLPTRPPGSSARLKMTSASSPAPSSWCPQVRGPLGSQRGRWHVQVGQWAVEELRLASAKSREGCSEGRLAQPPLPHRTAAPGSHRGAGWQPRLHCGCHLLVAGPGLADQVGNGCGMWGTVRTAAGPYYREPGRRQRVGGFGGQARGRSKQRAIWFLRDLGKFMVPSSCCGFAHPWLYLTLTNTPSSPGMEPPGPWVGCSPVFLTGRSRHALRAPGRIMGCSPWQPLGR